MSNCACHPCAGGEGHFEPGGQRNAKQGNAKQRQAKQRKGKAKQFKL